MRLCASLFRGVAAPLGCVICLQLGDVAVFFTLCAVLSERARWGWYHYSRSVSHGSETLRGRVSERQTLPLLGIGWVYARRTQKACGTAMRLCASLFRRLSAFFGSTRPSPKSGKTCRSDTRPGDVGERAERSESSDTTPIRNAPCFGV